MAFLPLFLQKFSHVALLRIENFTFDIHENAYFIPKNRSTQTVTKFSHVALLRINNFRFNRNKNAYFIPKNRST